MKGECLSVCSSSMREIFVLLTCVLASMIWINNYRVQRLGSPAFLLSAKKNGRSGFHQNSSMYVAKRELNGLLQASTGIQKLEELIIVYVVTPLCSHRRQSLTAEQDGHLIMNL